MLTALPDCMLMALPHDCMQMDFGSGALKITPAHDVNDYAIGKRHNLPIINIMNKDASLNELAGPYAGLDAGLQEHWLAAACLSPARA
jgi:valyl-tRNA synthetase